MPKLFAEEQLSAAVAAGQPPRRRDYPDDDEWHAKQADWLSDWSGDRLPDDFERGRQWDKLKHEHGRLVATAGGHGT